MDNDQLQRVLTNKYLTKLWICCKAFWELYKLFTFFIIFLWLLFCSFTNKIICVLIIWTIFCCSRCSRASSDLEQLWFESEWSKNFHSVSVVFDVKLAIKGLFIFFIIFLWRYFVVILIKKACFNNLNNILQKSL